jgi:hypothetical protein
MEGHVLTLSSPFVRPPSLICKNKGIRKGRKEGRKGGKNLFQITFSSDYKRRKSDAYRASKQAGYCNKG